MWKKVIRVIAHELNNSLAPIASLAHSGRLLAQAPDPAQLERVFATIAERAAHLATFIEGYGRFAKLPRPRPEAVPWPQLLARLEGTLAHRVVGPLPGRAAGLDAGQIEQVLINLLKNAAESGSAARKITLAIHDEGNGFRLEVADRGQRTYREHAARCAAALLLHQGHGDGPRAHALPRNRGGARRATEPRQPRRRRRARHGVAALKSALLLAARARALGAGGRRGDVEVLQVAAEVLAEGAVPLKALATVACR